MADDNNNANMVTLKSFDGVEFVVSEAVAMHSQAIRHVIEDDCAQDAIPLPNVDSKTLAKVIEYCTKHVTIAEKARDVSKGKKAVEESFAETTNKMSPEEELKKWDAEFLNVDTDTLYYLLLAANYLDVRDLLDLVCQKVADMIKGKYPEEIRKIFNIKNDFTPEEEAEIRRENEWAF